MISKIFAFITRLNSLGFLKCCVCVSSSSGYAVLAIYFSLTVLEVTKSQCFEILFFIFLENESMPFRAEFLFGVVGTGL